LAINAPSDAGLVSVVKVSAIHFVDRAEVRLLLSEADSRDDA